MNVLNKLLLLSALSFSPSPAPTTTVLPSGIDMENVMTFVEKYNPVSVLDDSLIGEHSFRIAVGFNLPSDDYFGNADENISYSFLPDYSSFSVLDSEGASFTESNPYYFQPISSNNTVTIGSTSLNPDEEYSVPFDLFFSTHFHSALVTTEDGLSADEDFILETSGAIHFTPSSAEITVDSAPNVSQFSNEDRVYNFSVNAPPAALEFKNVSRSLVSLTDPDFSFSKKYIDYSLNSRSIPGSSASVIFDIYENGEFVSTVNPAVEQTSSLYNFSYEVKGASKPASSELKVSYYDNFYAQKVADKY